MLYQRGNTRDVDEVIVINERWCEQIIKAVFVHVEIQAFLPGPCLGRRDLRLHELYYIVLCYPLCIGV